MNGRPRAKIALTRRALGDIQEILSWSEAHWGKAVAEKYLAEVEAGLNLLREHPHLLVSEPDFQRALSFYRIQKHLLVCDSLDDSIVVLTVIHSAMDIGCHLARLVPSLVMEVRILHEKLRNQLGKKA